MTCLVVGLGFKPDALSPEPEHLQHLSRWLLSGEELWPPSPNDHRDLHLAVSLQLCPARLLNGWGPDGKL